MDSIRLDMTSYPSQYDPLSVSVQVGAAHSNVFDGEKVLGDESTPACLPTLLAAASLRLPIGRTSEHLCARFHRRTRANSLSRSV